MKKYKVWKKYQKKLNKKIRTLNNAISEDSLWKGRFVFIYLRSRWEEFEDKSGGILHFVIRAYDKKTKYYKDYMLEYAPFLHTFNWKLSMECANDFIVEALDVWHLEPELRTTDTKDYTKVEIDLDKIKSKPYNFYINYKYLLD